MFAMDMESRVFFKNPKKNILSLREPGVRELGVLAGNSPFFYYYPIK